MVSKNNVVTSIKIQLKVAVIVQHKCPVFSFKC